MKKQQINYEQFEKERIIKISDLIEELFRKIWLIVAFAVVFAVILTGYKYSKDKVAVQAANAITDEDSETSLTDEELQQVDTVLLQQTRLEEQQEYLDNSILMKINACKENRVNLQFIVKGDENTAKNAISSLEYYVSSGALANDLQEKYPDVESNYLSELISFENDSDELQIGDTEYLNVKSNGNVFYISVMEQDAEQCQTLADNVVACLNEYQVQSAATIGTYELSLVDKSVTKVVDSDLQSFQNGKINDVNNLKNSIKDLKNNLSDVQLSVLNKNLEAADGTTKDNTDIAEQSGTVSVNLSKKYMGLGALVGIILAVIIIILRYVLRGTLNVALEMQHMFNLCVFGQIASDGRKNILVKAWRKLKNKRNLSVEEQKNITVANVKTFCLKRGIDKVLLVSSREKIAIVECVTAIMSELKRDGIFVDIAEKFPYSEESIKKMMNYEYVILVEELRKSKYEEVLQGVQKCMEQECQLEGAIVLD